MKVHLARIGRGRCNWADEATHDYAKRLGRQLKFSEELVRPEPFHGDVQAVRNQEAERLLARLKPRDRLVALDERGLAIDSKQMAQWIEESANQGTSRLFFALGGPYGHGERVRQASWRVLSLSPMVLNHELARVVLVEQLYRASTLIWGGSYHH